MDGQVNMDAEASMEIGVMFWAGRDDLAEIHRLFPNAKDVQFRALSLRAIFLAMARKPEEA